MSYKLLIKYLLPVVVCYIAISVLEPAGLVISLPISIILSLWVFNGLTIIFNRKNMTPVRKKLDIDEEELLKFLSDTVDK